jgi:hypothetical protein
MHTERQKDKQAKNCDGGCFSNFFCEYYTKVICYKNHIFGIGKHNQGKKREIGKGGILQKRGLLEWVPRELGLVRDHEARRGSDYISYFYDCFSMKKVNVNCHFGNSFVVVRNGSRSAV